MIGAFRRSRLLLVTAAIALLSVIPMVAFPLIHGGDDYACDQGVPAPDSTRHRLHDGSTAPAQERHCQICHWSQSIRAIHEDAVSVLPSAHSGPVATSCVVQPRTITASRSFARAPPVA
jgi:hypothetical protein